MDVTKHIHHRWAELKRITRERTTGFYHSLIASKVMRYRYHIIAILSLLLVVEVVPLYIWDAVLADVFPSFLWDPLPVDPVVYPLLWLGIFGATSLAWMGMAALIAIERTVHWFSIQHVYYVFVVFPLLVVAQIGLLTFAIESPLRGFALAVGMLSMPLLGIAGIVTVIILRTVLASKPRTLRLYVVAVLAAIVVTSALCIILVIGLWILREMGGSLEQFSGVLTALLLLTIPVYFPILVTILISMIRRPHQHLVVGGVVLWAVITIGILVQLVPRWIEEWRVAQ